MSAGRVPRVSVVMPLFNGAEFVEAAVASILEQTWTDFQLVVVDDGSTDDGPERVAAVRDERVQLIRLPTNSGISVALNVGVAAAAGSYIARMDADDVSLPERLAAQVQHLDRRPQVGAVGTIPFLMDADGGRRRLYPLLVRDEELRRSLTLQGPFCHGSVMFRKTVFEAAGGYRSEDEPAEDYALWVRMAQLSELENLPQALYCLRVGDHSVSARNRERQLRRRDEIRQQTVDRLGEPRLTHRSLREGLRHYRLLRTPLAPELALRYAQQHQELACLGAARRGVHRTLRSLLVSAALGPWRPRTYRRMVRLYRAERQRRDLLASG